MKKINLLIVLLTTVSFISSCSTPEKSKDTTIEVTDMIGRKVDVPTSINKIVCIGAGSLRLLSYFNSVNKLSGIEDVEKVRKSKVSIRPYQLANEDYFKTLPSCGVGGPGGSADAEKILSCDPDIVFSLYTADVSAMDNLQKSIATPVVTFAYGNVAPFNDVLPEAITLMGKILNEEKRAEELNSYIDSVIEDISTRTSKIKEEDKPSVYLGCNSFYGTHGFNSTSANYASFSIGNIKNATSEYLKEHTSLQINETDLDLDTIIDMDPDKIILDAGGISVLKTQYATNEFKGVFDSLKAVKNNEVYIQMPFNAYYTNIELGLCNAYYTASVVYPEKFDDVNIDNKITEILTTFLGKDCYEKVKEEMYGGYQKITNISEFLS